MNIIDLILKIEKRPALYISKNYISCLKSFLDGWSMNDNSSDNQVVIGDFQIWIEDKYRINSSQSWADIILFYSTDENDALNNFFPLFNEFLEQKSSLDTQE
nr:hypothetical protein [Moraxella osloensis]